MHEIQKALFIATHPDDETLGCGGTILKLKEADVQIFWLIMTRGYEEDGFSIESIDEKKDQITKVSDAYGFHDVRKLGLRTTLLDSYDTREITDGVSAVILDLNPDTIFAPHRNDVHSDHRIVFDAVWSASKSFRAPLVRNVITYETVSETEYAHPLGGMHFTPNLFVDITKHMDRKLEIAATYHDELQPHPFPRSLKTLKALAEYRGASAYVEYAEAFMSLKSIS